MNKETILEKCSQISIDGVVSIASDVAVTTVCFVAERLGLISNEYSDVLACTNKYEMRKRFTEHNINCPKFISTDNIETEINLKFPVILKPVDRSGSRGVTKVNKKDEFDVAFVRAQSESFLGKVIVEEYITGYEVSVETISWQGNHHVLAITDKDTTGEPFFVELAHHQPSLLPDFIKNRIKIETIKTLDSLNVKYGASHAEFKITNDGKVFAIETGARMGGDFIGSDLVKLSTGYDFVKGVIEIALGEFNEPTRLFNKFSGVYFISAETERLLSLLESDFQHNWIIEKSVISKELKKAQCSADRSGYIIYQADKKIII